MVQNKTEGVRVLIEEVLSVLPRPYTEDVTEDVFVAIENQPVWLQRYRELESELGEKHSIRR